MTITEFAEAVRKGDDPEAVLRVALARQREADSAIVLAVNDSYRSDGLSIQRGFAIEAAAAIQRGHA